MASLRSIFNHSSMRRISSIARISNKSQYPSSDKQVPLGSNTIALKKALCQCRKEIKKSKRWKLMPSPVCFEHAAMLLRQTKNYQDEIKVCQLYLSCVDECLSKRIFNKKRTQRKAHSLCKPLTARLQAAKNIGKNCGVDVHYLS